MRACEAGALPTELFVRGRLTAPRAWLRRPALAVFIASVGAVNSRRLVQAAPRSARRRMPRRAVAL